MENTEKRPIRQLTWSQVESSAFKIASIIKAKHPVPSRVYKGIIAFPRGGLPFATMLAHKLDIGAIYTSYEFCIRAGINKKLPDGHYLIVDDLSDTGSTFRDYISTFQGEDRIYDRDGVTFETAAILYRPSTSFMPDYVDLNAHEDWIAFPWEGTDAVGQYCCTNPSTN